MPRGTRKVGVTLGFLGKREVEPTLVIKLLDDLIAAEGEAIRFLVPVTKDHWSSTLEMVVDYALDQGIPLEAVTDRPSSTSRAVRAILGHATKTYTVSRVSHRLVDLLATQPNPKMIFSWDSSEEAYNVLELTSLQSIDARDLAQGLVPIEWGDPAEESIETNQGEQMAEDVDESEFEDEDETESEEGDGEDGEGEGEAEDGEEEGEAEEQAEYQPYTEAELDDFSDDDLRQLCQENEVEIPAKAGRARMISAILAAQEALAGDGEDEDADEDAEGEEDEEDAEAEEEAEEAEGVFAEIAALDPEVQAKANADALAPEFEALRSELQEMQSAITSKLTALTNAVKNIKVEVAAPAPAKAAAPARPLRKIGPPAKAAAKKTTKPAAKKPVAKKAARPAAKATAKRTGAGRGRGRPPLPEAPDGRKVHRKGSSRYESWMAKYQNLFED